MGLSRYNLISVGEENETFFIRVWKLLPSRRGLKPCGEAGEGKPKKGNILAAGLGRYNPTLVGEENDTFFIRVWKPLPSRCVLKPCGEA